MDDRRKKNDRKKKADPRGRREHDKSAPDPVLTEEDVLRGALEAKLQESPSVEQPVPRPALSALPKAPPVVESPPVVRTFETRPVDMLGEFFFDDGEVAPTLAEVGADERPRSAEVTELRREYLSFLFGSEEYALDIQRVREIIKPMVITEVPRAPSYVLGVITLRGEVIAVFDLRMRLGLPAAPMGRRARIVICETGNGPCGIVVDAVSHVVRLPPSAIEPKPHGISGQGSDYISGIGRQAGRLYILLDLPLALRREGPSASRISAKEAR